MTFRRIYKLILKIALVFLGAIVVFFLWSWWVEWRPAAVEVVFKGSGELIERDTLKIVSWNIGYGGLGDNTDFFYDGGEMVRDTRERTQENLEAIVEFLQQHTDADFILLQEVDVHSKRTYYIDEFELLSQALHQYKGWMGLNYVSSYVPIPVFEPIGQIKSGLAIFSKYEPLEIKRLQYPSEFSWPVRMFNLKRCLLSGSFRWKSGTLFVNNTHNTAYDTGGMREQEFKFLGDYLNGKTRSVSIGDWNSNPPGYIASEREKNDQNFSPISLSEGALGEGQRFFYDKSGVYSMRYGYEPYQSGQTARSVLDFVALGSELELLDIEVVDLGFEHSDHNPVIVRFF